MIQPRTVDFFSNIRINPIKTSTVKKICLLTFFVFIVLQSWIADDAYHVFVMTKNFLDGHGLVYNIGERVSAATSPLMLLMITGISYITKQIELTAIGIGIVSSTVAFWVLIRKMNSCVSVIVGMMLCLMSYGLMAYTTSGLETSLILLAEIVYFELVLNHEGKYGFVELILVAFLCCLALLVRLDACFVLFFPTAYIFLRRNKCGYIKMMFAGVLGLLPLFAWLVFSIIYYGYPFPNTYYIKLSTSLPISDYLIKGLNYFKTTLLCDTITVSIIIVAIILCLKRHDFLFKWIAIGLLLKVIYIIRIGGDFMLGRHLAGLYFISIYLVFYCSVNSASGTHFSRSLKVILFLAMVAATLMNSAGRKTLLYPSNEIADERAFYIDNTSLKKIIASKITGHNYPLNQYKWDVLPVKQCLDNNYKGDVLPFAPGILVYNYVDKLYMTDSIGLPDPLLPYMDVDLDQSYFENDVCKWRIGHIRRILPEGYRESLQQGENIINDNTIQELYDKIILVVRGDLFTKERFQAIWDLNTNRRQYTVREG